MNRIGSVLIMLSMLFCLTGCGGLDDPDYGGGSVFNELGGEIQADDDSSAEIPEGAITDAAGEFYYAGKLQQGGDDENGYIQVPLGYVDFQDEDVEGLTQYSDVAGKNIITLDYYEGMKYQLVAENMRSYLQSDDTIFDLQGATTTVGNCNALQIYGHYDDGYFIVIWFIEDPEDTDSSYYLAMEFDSDHSYLVACSSTFQTKEQYHDVQTGTE